MRSSHKSDGPYLAFVADPRPKPLPSRGATQSESSKPSWSRSPDLDLNLNADRVLSMVASPRNQNSLFTSIRYEHRPAAAPGDAASVSM